MEALFYGKLGDRIYRRAHTRAGLRSVDYFFLKPLDPKTKKQLSCRNNFAQGMENWQALGRPEKERYRVATKELPLLGHNLFLKFFLLSQKNRAELFLVANWQKILEQLALKWALERRLELEVVPTTPKKIQNTN